ncbi:hybrid sensor histidine kinase/response regulator [Methanocalculus chunghsingensis]|uniref:hybrid sensor histidine kinase/response regulator n=1 Tax=Methanocalculus chunghsingensis TaxID=156457 RepID=UPI001B8B4465|nr:PAS domain S-box protein [Methanocalculus chunghsingensis]
MTSVLLVDDDPALLEVTRLFLERDGFSVTIAGSGREALKKLAETPFDAIVSDYEMPLMDGLALLSQVRSFGMTIPFVIFTGRGREEVAIQALNKGADFYIRKGGDPKSQFAELGNAIRRSVAYRQAERKFEILISALPDPTFSIDDQGYVTTWNRAMEDMTGIPADEMIGRGEFAYAVPIYGTARPMLIDIAAGLAPDKDERLGYSTFWREGHAFYAESSQAKPRGTPVFLWGKATPLFDDAGRLSGAIETIRDISYRVALEQDLQTQYESLSVVDEELKAQMEEVIARDHEREILLAEIKDQQILLDTIFDITPVNFYVYDRECRFRYACKKGAYQIGMTPEEMAGHHWRELGMPAAIMEPLEASLREVFATGEEIEVDASYPTIEGERYYRCIITPMGDAGHPDLVLVTVLDVTETRMAEVSLREQGEYCHLLFDSAGDALLLFDDLTVSDCNRRAMELFGFSHDELIGRKAGRLSPEFQPCGGRSRDLLVGLLARAEEGELQFFEWKGLRSDGTLLDLEATVSPLMMGGRQHLLAVIRDISERKRHEGEINHLLSHIPGMVYRCDIDRNWTMRFISDGCRSLTGYAPDDLIDNRVISWNDLILPDHRERLWDEWRGVIETKGVFEGEYPIRRRDGEIRWVWERGAVVYEEDGSPRFIEGFITDITDRRFTEDSIRHLNEKLALLASVTRHDLKNRLGTILGYLDLMEEPDPLLRLDEGIPKIKEMIGRVLRMIAFAQDYQEIGLHGVSWQNLPLTAAHAADSVDTSSITIARDLPPMEILADPLFEKVIATCIDNAIRHGEKVTRIRLSAGISDDGLSIICEDDGIGIPLEEKSRIFERGVGKNTGLGLFLARAILAISGMSILEEGICGEGARFVILVPPHLYRYPTETPSR